MTGKDFDSNMVVHNVPTMALLGITVFPNVVFHFDVGRQKSIKALDKAMASDQMIFLVSQKDLSVEEPEFANTYRMGTLAKIKQVLRLPGGTLRVMAEGVCRAFVYAPLSEKTYLRCDIYKLAPQPKQATTKRDIALIRNLQSLFIEYSELAPKLGSDIVSKIMESDDFEYISDYIAQNILIKHHDKQRVLEQTDPRKRCTLLTKILMEEIDILTIEFSIQSKVKEQMEKNQRDYFLREQIKVINEELGEGEDSQSEAQKYIARIIALKLPEDMEKKLLKEANRLAKMQASSPEGGVIRTYLDICLELPWHNMTRENSDIRKAEEVLNAQHYGLEKVKERMLEFFAVKTLSGSLKGQIICLVGPPGVGKTSVVKSVAQALGRNYARLSLGGVRDEADIRGHRRTYIGAMPGRIITSLKQAGSKNPLILIDEIDKLGADYKGDPSSALLEVFDTEQNYAFVDHYIDMPFDLSDVLFICTANNADNIPAPLYDRMEIIELSGYTTQEKLHIGRRHLLPKQLKANGLKPANLAISDEALLTIIEGYTKEAGVRSLERELAKLCRKTAKYMLETGKKSLKVTAENINKYLGNARYKKKSVSDMPVPGVVNGLAWTAVGGELLEVEAVALDGTGKQELTGNLGDVMKESTRAAMTYIRSRADALNIPTDFSVKKDIHLHFPEGAVPKDGPSAGITIATALISALTGIPVPKTIAMTGEITLTGRVLPIGGLKEKTMAAYINGATTVIVPEDNRVDIDDIDPACKAAITFVYARHMDDVVDAVFDFPGSVIPQLEDAIKNIELVLPGVSQPAQAIRP